MSDVKNTSEHEKSRRSRQPRVPIILQDESSECGLACVAMVLGAWGHHIDLADLRDEFGTSSTGITLTKLISIAESMHLAVQAVSLKLPGMRRLCVPAILHWNHDHFVVLVKVADKGIVIHDPSAGRSFVRWHEVERKFTGIALEAAPTPALLPKKATARLPFRKLFTRASGIRPAVIKVVALALALEAIALILPLITQVTVDVAIPSDDTGLLTVASLGFLCLAVAQSAISWARGVTVIELGASVSLKWTSDLYGHLLRLPSLYFAKRKLGNILSRFHAVTVVQDMMTTRFVDVALDGTTVAVTIAALLFYSPTLALVSLIGFLLYAVMRMLTYGFVRQANVDVVQTDAARQDLLVESVRASQTIRLHNAVDVHVSRFRRFTTNYMNASLRVQRVTSLFASASGLTLSAQRVITFWVGGLLVIHGRLSVGMLIAFVFYSAQFTERASKLLDFFIDFRMLLIQVDRLADIELANPERFTHQTSSEDFRPPSIEFRNVSFSYGNGDAAVLNNLSFVISAGESVAIIGPSGAGKSTIAKLMLGLIDPDQGSILFDGVPIEKIGKATIRRMSSTVFQEDCLLSGTIEENIHFFSDTPDFDRVEAAARIACVDKEIENFPMRYRTHVGSLGSALSSGQQQRVLLARAIYRRPGLLVLDEATSHLDVANERRINENLRNLAVTRVIIAHRPETIFSADRVIRVGVSGDSDGGADRQRPAAYA